MVMQRDIFESAQPGGGHQGAANATEKESKYGKAGDDRMVRHLWSAGRHIVQDGRHIARDQVRTRFAAVMARLATVL